MRARSSSQGGPGRGVRARQRCSYVRFVPLRLLEAGGLLAVATLIPLSSVCAQDAASSEAESRREVYEYSAGGRDPFRKPWRSADIGRASVELRLRGVMYSEDPHQSVAVLEEASGRRFRARVGQRVGGVTVIAILPRRVDLLITEAGAPRRQSLYLRVEAPAEIRP
jgi:hypothetical protein